MAGLGSLLAGLGGAGQTLNYGEELRRQQQLAQLQMALQKQQIAQGQQAMQQRQQAMSQTQQQYQQSQTADRLAGLAGLSMNRAPMPQGAPPRPPMPQGAMPPPPSGASGGAAGGPSPAAAPPVPGAGAGGGQTSPQAAMQNAFGPPDTPYGYTLGAVMNGIKKVNPNVDPADALRTAERLQQLLAPEAKMQLQEANNQLAQQNFELKVAALDARERDAQRRLDQGDQRIRQGEDRLLQQQDALEQKKAVGELREKLVQMQIDGVDPKEIQRHKDRLDEIEARGKVTGAKGATANAKADVKSAEADMAFVNTKINNIKAKNQGFTPGPGSADWPELQKLMQQRAQINDALTAARKKLADAGRQATTDLGGADNAANKAKFPGAPDIGKVEDGHVYQGGDPASQDSWKPQ